MLKKKMILISPAHPLRGGIAASSERLAHELREMGHEVVMYSFSLQYPSFLFPGKTQFSDSAAPDNLVIHSTINSINPFSWLRTAWLIGQSRPDLVITRYWLPFMAPALGTILALMRWFGSKQAHRVALVDNLIPHEKRPGDRLLSRYFAAQNDAFLAMSESVAADIRAMTSQKSVLVSPHPIYDHYGSRIARAEAHQHLQLDASKPWLMFFGFIRAYKGLDLLLHALADVRLRAADVRLLIAGECYENWQTYQDIINQHGLQNCVTLRTDYIPDTEVRSYFSAADLVVQPYKTATQSGITQIALHFNQPTLVTNVGGLPEMVNHLETGYVVEPTPAAIADAVMLYLPILRDESRQKQMFDAIEKEKARFSWRLMAERLVGIG
jgi:D-inositol-3-phosphate glycosyltransferase